MRFPATSAISNTYSTEFFAKCPNNGIRIKYRLWIDSPTPIPVEQINAAVDAVDDVFHEEIADTLAQRLPGHQILTADHHGVTIETIREGAPQ